MVMRKYNLALLLVCGIAADTPRACEEVAQKWCQSISNYDSDKRNN